MFSWSETGAANLEATSSADPTVSDGGLLWVRATLDVDGGTSGEGRVTFYTGGFGITPAWVALGTPQDAGSSPTSIQSTSGVLEVGTRNTGSQEPLAGKVHQVQVYNGINGTLVFDADFSTLSAAEVAAASFTESSSNAATVTLNGSGWYYVYDTHGKNAYLSLDATDISAYSDQVSTGRTKDTVETTTYKTDNKTFIDGLRTHDLNMSGKWHPTLEATIAATDDGAAVTVVYGPEGNATGDIQYTSTAFFTGYQVDVAAGSGVTWSASYKPSSTVTRAAV